MTAGARFVVPLCDMCGERRSKFEGNRCMECHKYESFYARAVKKAKRVLALGAAQPDYQGILREVFNTKTLRFYLEDESAVAAISECVREDAHAAVE